MDDWSIDEAIAEAFARWWGGAFGALTSSGTERRKAFAAYAAGYREAVRDVTTLLAPGAVEVTAPAETVEEGCFRGNDRRSEPWGRNEGS